MRLDELITEIQALKEKGERKINCYVVKIPKEVGEKTNLKDANLKISSKDNKIIIEKLEKGE